MFLVGLLYLLFASTFTLGKAALGYISPILFIAIRMLLGGTLLLLYQYLFNRSKWRFDLVDSSSFFHIALFLIFISFVGEFWALQYVSASKASLLYNMSPFITALFAYYMLAERLSRKQLIGLIIGFLGFLPILMDQSPGEQVTRHFGFISTPELFLIIAVISAAYGWMVMRYLVVERNYSSIMVNGVGMVGGGFMALITSIFFEGIPSISNFDQVIMIGFYTVALILIANIICFNLYGFLLKEYSATLLSFAGFTTPLFAALLDFIFFNQPVTLGFMATILFVFIGLWLFYQDEFKMKMK